MALSSMPTFFSPPYSLCRCVGGCVSLTISCFHHTSDEFDMALSNDQFVEKCTEFANKHAAQGVLAGDNTFTAAGIKLYCKEVMHMSGADSFVDVALSKLGIVRCSRAGACVAP